MLPHLIHPIPITIQVLNHGGSIVDVDHREPVQQAARFESVIVPGQVSTTDQPLATEEAQGLHLSAWGYVLFRYIDLEEKSVVLKINDRFIKMGWIEVNFYINRLQPVIHFDDMGGATMVKAFYTDRFPSKK